MELALIRLVHRRTCIYWIAACFTSTGLRVGVTSENKTIDQASGVKTDHLKGKKKQPPPTCCFKPMNGDLRLAGLTVLLSVYSTDGLCFLN